MALIVVKIKNKKINVTGNNTKIINSAQVLKAIAEKRRFRVNWRTGGGISALIYHVSTDMCSQSQRLVKDVMDLHFIIALF